MIQWLIFCPTKAWLIFQSVKLRFGSNPDQTKFFFGFDNVNLFSIVVRLFLRIIKLRDFCFSIPYHCEGVDCVTMKNSKIPKMPGMARVKKNPSFQRDSTSRTFSAMVLSSTASATDTAKIISNNFRSVERTSFCETECQQKSFRFKVCFRNQTDCDLHN